MLACHLTDGRLNPVVWKLDVGFLWATVLSVVCSDVACSDATAPEVVIEATPVVKQENTPGHVDVALAEIVATCANIVGEVEVRRGGEAHWTPVQLGATFRAGDWVRTKEGATARVQFLASGALDLEAMTTIIIEVSGEDANHPTGSPVVALESGVAIGVMNRLGVSTRALLVRKDGSVVGLRPASDEVAYRLSKTEDGTEVAVIDGQLSVSTEDSTVEIADGQSAEVSRRGLGPVYRMIGFPISVAPGVDARFLYAKETPITLRWKKVKKARSYHLQVARDLSFQSLVIDSVVTGTKAVFIPPAIGVYAWRVAARDKKGRYGEYGFTRRIFSEKAAPRDLLLSPPHGIKIAYEKSAPPISFSWQSAGETKSYLLAVGHGANPLKNAVFTVNVSKQVYVSTELTAGQYTWGVYIGDDNEPIFLKARRLTVQKRTAPKINADGIWD